MGLTVKDMCKIVHELLPDVDITVAGIFGEGIDDKAWCYSTIYDSKPPDFDNLTAKDEEVRSVEVAKDEKLNVEAVYVYFDANKKEKDMNHSQNKEPLKLLTMLAYLECDEGSDIWLEIRLEKRGENGSRCLFVEGYAKDLKNEPSMFNGYYIERILYDKSEDDYDKHDLIIQAVKEEKK